MHGYEIQIRSNSLKKIERGTLCCSREDQIQDKEESSLVQEETNEENGIILDLEGNEIESKSAFTTRNYFSNDKKVGR